MKAAVAALCAVLLVAETSGETSKRKSSVAEKTATSSEPPGGNKTSSAANVKPASGSDKGKGLKSDEATPAKRAKESSAEAAGVVPKAESASAETKKPKKRATSGTSERAEKKQTKKDKPPQDNAGEEPTRNSRVTGPNITLDPQDLADFDKNPEPVKRLILLGLDLTRQGLIYRYGSSDPSTGGMDCSGTIYYLLKAAGVKEPPRDSSGLYLWAEKEGTLHRVNPASLEDPTMDELRPGDLLFWEGTYEVQRDPPISHTMIYLGREKATGIRVMVGASDGRTYGPVKRNGVSVFDFKLPRAGSAARFVAYGRVPGLK
jgi:peptidoglycan DL-endopeptidase CwlO